MKPWKAAVAEETVAARATRPAVARMIGSFFFSGVRARASEQASDRQFKRVGMPKRRIAVWTTTEQDPSKIQIQFPVSDHGVGKRARI